jgi:hypothetical protein
MPTGISVFKLNGRTYDFFFFFSPLIKASYRLVQSAQAWSPLWLLAQMQQIVLELPRSSMLQQAIGCSACNCAALPCHFVEAFAWKIAMHHDAADFALPICAVLI